MSCSLRSAKGGSSTLVTQIETDLMIIVLQSKVEAKRNQRRSPTSYIDNVKADIGLQIYEVIHQSRDRDRWRPVVARSGAPTDGHGHGDKGDIFMSILVFFLPTPSFYCNILSQ